jgi:Structure-specific recognition protein (SSRP1)
VQQGNNEGSNGAQGEDGGHVFELPLSEVGDVQGGKEDAILDFHVDDGTLGPNEDALSSVTFTIPEGNHDFVGAHLPPRLPARCLLCTHVFAGAPVRRLCPLHAV